MSTADSPAQWPDPSQPSSWATPARKRLLLRVAAILLALWAFSFCIGSRDLQHVVVDDTGVETDETVTVRCESMWDTGWEGRWTFDILQGPDALPSQVVDEIDARCDRYRTWAAAYIGMLAVPIAILGTLSFAHLISRLADPVVDRTRLRG